MSIATLDQHLSQESPPFPGIPQATDGTTAVVVAETAASEAAGAYPITPATQMGEGWAAAAADGQTNVFGRRLLFFEPEGEHAAAAVTAGMSMVGLRAANFSAGQGIAYMHESLYAAVGKRLTYVLNVACRAMTKHSLNIHAGHDDYHAIDDTGFFQLFAKNAQEAGDLNLIAHRVAELALNPGICAQDGFLTSHSIETVRLPERELVKAYLGDPADLIPSPTPAQRMVFGDTRRRVPELFDMDHPAMLGTVQNQESYAQGVAAQRPFYFDHIARLTDEAMEEYARLTGRRYRRASGYLTDDAEYLVLAQGSLVWNLEALCDHLRDTTGLKLGIVNLTMFRPFPEDLVSTLLKGRKAVTILERVDQPLAADLPVAREVRAVLGKALENGRAPEHKPHPALESYAPGDAPDIYSGVFGLGSRDTQPGDMLAAVENMLPGGRNRRFFYLGFDFVRKDTELPGLVQLREQILESYPEVADLALPRSRNVDLMPADALSVRMHSVGGWGAITTGKNLALTLFDLLGLQVKANPKYGSEKKGQPTTFYATFSREPLRLNCDLSHVHVVMSPDPNVFKHSNPLAGLQDGGVFILQAEGEPEEVWSRLPASARKAIKAHGFKLFYLDGFKIAREEASDAEFQYRMQGAAFQGAFFKASPLMAREGLDEATLFAAIRDQLQHKFGHRGARVVEDNVRVIRRGWDELRAVDCAAMPDPTEADAPKAAVAPASFRSPDQLRFFDQVGAAYATGQDPTADPFAALSAMPAATSALRDMTNIRFEIPEFLPERCTGCGQCWTQCPDSAIPGLVTEVGDLLRAGMAAQGAVYVHLPGVLPGLVDEVRATLRQAPFHRFHETVAQAWRTLAARLDLDRPKRAALDEELEALGRALADVPVARAKPFFDVPEGREPGSGGLLTVTVNPQTCKGCMLCVDVCPDRALVARPQGPAEVETLRRNQAFVDSLPDTPDRFVNVRSYDEGIGVLNTLLLKRGSYRVMVGGDGACMGCGEKTALHLVTSAIEAAMQPRVAAFVDRLTSLIRKVDEKARLLLVADADLDGFGDEAPTHVDVTVSASTRERLRRVTALLRQLKDLKSRYLGGRASLGICNATGCSSVWGGSYPYNPYPYPWANHLFQDAPSLAIGVFEGFMRKMADAFGAVRKAEIEVADGWNPEVHEPFFEAFDWQGFDDEEFKLCPPILAAGGDGAMFDIGFQNLSRLLASGKPIRVVVLDTQVYSNTGGQACTSGFTGQVSDMATYGRASHGKMETRKELPLLGIAHRGAYVMQSSQANASHLVAGILKGLSTRRPALFCIHTPCMPEHGISDDASYRTSRMAVEGRATPFLVYDPDAGPTMADRLDLSGNPSLEDPWPTYELTHVSEGAEHTMELPVTTADWAAGERRFARHFRPLKRSSWGEAQVVLHEYLALPKEQRAGRTPFLHTLEPGRTLGRLSVSPEMVALTEERLGYWNLLKEMAGLRPSEAVREAVAAELEQSFEERLEALRAAHEAALDEMRTAYPETVARRLSEVLVRGDLAAPAVPAPRSSAPAPRPSAPVEEEPEGDLPWIDSPKCTTCDECLKVNPKMFAYDGERRAYVADPRAGSFKDLVTAAERCSAGIIHPGAPLNPKERDLEKWLSRAEPFR